MRGQVVFVGCVEVGRECLEELLECGADVRAVITLDPELARTTSGYVTFDALAWRFGFPVFPVRSVDDADVIARLRGLAPDVIFVIGWQRLLPRMVLEIPRHSCVGMHASLLPRYRGHAPVNWAIINGERETGMTMLYLDERADAGDIIDQRAFPIELEDTCATVYAKAALAGRQMLRTHLAGLLSGIAPRRPQVRLETPMPRRRPEDGAIDWGGPSRAIYDWVRALTRPYPGAFSFVGGRRLYVWETRLVAGAKPDLAPGTVVRVGLEGVLVATGDGVLLLTSVELEGGTGAEEGESGPGQALEPGVVLGCPPSQPPRHRVELGHAIG